MKALPSPCGVKKRDMAPSYIRSKRHWSMGSPFQIVPIQL